MSDIKSDKIFYGCWGIAIVMIGVCILLGYVLSLPVLGTILLWVLSIGAILISAGLITLKKSRSTAVLQLTTGLILIVLSTGSITVLLRLLDIVLTIGVLIIIIGISVVTLGLLKKR